MSTPSEDPSKDQLNSNPRASQSFDTPVPFLDTQQSIERIESIRRAGISVDLADWFVMQLKGKLRQVANPDQVLHRVERFLRSSRSPQSLVLLFERDPDSLDALTRLFSVSSQLAEYLIDDPEAFDLLRMTGGQPIDRDVLVDEINAECASAWSTADVEPILRRHRRRETLRVAYGDLVAGQTVEQTGQQLAFLADAIIGAAITTARRLLIGKPSPSRHGDLPPATRPEIGVAVHDHAATELSAGRLDSRPPAPTDLEFGPRLTCLATGSYGGQEQGYGDQLEALLIGDTGQDPTGISPVADLIAPSMIDPQDFLQNWAQLVIQLLEASDRLGPTYRLCTRLRPSPEFSTACDAEALVRYFELSGRTWHRREFIKARVAAGNIELGELFLRRLEPWIYHRFLGAADQEGIRSLKRKLTRGINAARSENHEGSTALETLAHEMQDLAGNTAAEIESVVGFLQLLNGTDLAALRVGNTLRAIEALEQTGCLTMQERTFLTENYIAMRRLGHLMQIGSIEDVPAAFASLAKDSQSLKTEFVGRRAVCRRIIDHLTRDVFTEAEETPIETEMILDPDFNPEAAAAVLRGYGFDHPEVAMGRLQSAASESIRFLSDRRSRHFFAGIAPKLLEEIATTPHPDETLERFAAITDSLGGKAALFELFQTTPSTMRLCVRLCAISPYLTGILTNNPGMLDELIDSLLLDRLPQFDEFEESSKDLCRYAEDVEPILHSLKNSAHLRIGVRDVMGRDSIRASHRAISDTAEVCLRRAADEAWQFMMNRFGVPQDFAGQPVGLTLMALGKLGGREPNYHSDLEIMFLYDAEGQTRPLAGGRRDSTTNSHFFHELSQRISNRVNHYGPWGRLFELDSRIRLSQGRGAIAVTIQQFRDHFRSSNCLLWQRLALVSARIIYGTHDVSESISATATRIDPLIREALLYPHWNREMALQAAQSRADLQRGAAPQNIKRGAGGTMDVEAIVQMVLLRRAADLDGRLGVGTTDGLELLRNRGWIDIEAAQHLATGYRYLRNVESNLRLMNLPARHDLPQATDDLRGLAFAMRESHWSVVVQKCDAYRQIIRQLFETIFTEEAGTPVNMERMVSATGTIVSE
jgi:glutamate-ammonia-ligase adenylyltransferase